MNGVPTSGVAGMDKPFKISLLVKAIENRGADELICKAETDTQM